MKKHIVIIGGGISGLALLHYTKQLFPKANIVLLEKNDHCGGTIRSVKEKGCLFETGPNGFLDSKPRTLEFIKELGLERSLLPAYATSKERFISLENKLHPLPSSPKSFLASDLLNPFQKIRILGEFFMPRGKDTSESVYDFGKRRLGERFAQIFLDSMVSGVFGGDARRTNLKAAFPRIYELEQKYGSLFRAMIKIRKARQAKGKTQDKTVGSPTGTLTSLRGGLEEIIEALEDRYREEIHLNAPVETVYTKEEHYEIFCTGGERYIADEVFVCAPAYGAAPILKSVDEAFYSELNKINYAPIAVVGLVIPAEHLGKKPAGYGYLIPSLENKEVLGVLFESDIFAGRCGNDEVLFRVMIGGARHPDICRKTKEEFIALAMDEIRPLMGPSGENYSPERSFFVAYEKAIPQYDRAYCEAMEQVEQLLQKVPGLHLVANYVKGVALNSCIENAYQAAQSSKIF